jgi:FtsZ-binding cell division protein ZapB
MLRNFAYAIALSCLFVVSSYAQNYPNASPNDWEEINFDYNSAVLSDGFPSLLRLADLLKAHPGYHVRIEGNTDNLGSARFNDRLGLARANAVRDFLVKYGANPNQITTATRGKSDQKYPGSKSTYSRTDVARWMNRRVVLTVTDEQGRTVSDGGAREAIQAIQPPPTAAGPNCCEDILKRLDKLDDIAKMLQQLVDQNAALQKEVDNLKNQQATLQNRVDTAPKPLTEAQTGEVVQKQLEAKRQPRFSLLGVNAGTDDVGNLTFSGKGRFFAPFEEHFAFQADAEYLYFHTQREGQLDFGLIDRIGNFQGGLFSSFKHVNLAGAGNGGNLGQGALTIDYLFKFGRLGIFGTKGFLNNSVLDTRNLTFATGLTNPDGAPILSTAPNIFVQRYLSIIDQAGVSTTIGLWGKNYLEANLGYLRSIGNADRPGGTVRFIFPIGERFAFTAEGGLNETLIGPGNNGRAVFGFQWGNFMRPKDYQSSGQPAPADVPRIRYEVLSRQIHKGVSPPVADAGPDQIGVPAGTITLNGSGSHDPNGEQLAFQWVQEAGPTVSISSATSAIATFTAAPGMAYTFRLTVRNTDNQTASAMTRITTQALQKTHIQFFNADPASVTAGQASTLSWKIANATSATISPTVGTVNAQNGNTQVSPTTTTTYTLTAKNGNSTDSATVTVTVQQPLPQLTVCTAVPMTINQGESANIIYNTLNATSVTITPGVGTVSPSGQIAVSPASTTTYTLTATNPYGSNSCTVSIQVTPGTAPRILRFAAGPMQITSGGTSTLRWQVENATTVSISPAVGTVQLAGAQSVQPTQTTTYTLTASNNFGSVTATATVTVTAAPPVNPTITSFTANPTTSPSPGSPVVLTCLAKNASKVTVSGIGDVNSSGNITVNPQTTTTYVCVAVNSADAQASANLTVPVSTGGGGGSGTGPVITVTSSSASCLSGTVVGGGSTSCQTVVRFIDLNLSATSASGNTPLTYFTVSRNNQALVLNPTSATPSLQLGVLKEDYLFDVTVTDSKGNKTTVTIDVQYV